ncbi:MAG: carboxypeptidase regulatory-like domain-containing protein [Deltaproteobacteria bacterium]|nr:carboxypeptidase regulatory-like domain-containing protein [Deltaproteobacteria bacterium]
MARSSSSRRSGSSREPAGRSRAASRGYTLLEVAVVLATVAILAAAVLPMAFQLMGSDRERQSLSLLADLKRGISGDPVIIVNEARTSFGYVGDMGTIPSSLQDLWIRGSQPAYSFNSTLKIGAGWNGPYVSPVTVQYVSSRLEDAWGNLLTYTTTSGVASPVGVLSLASVISPGRNAKPGDSDDLTVRFYNPEVQSKVFGLVKDDDGNPVAGANVTINYPQNGVLTPSTVQADSDGFYQFDNIPYGNRSITVDPKLVLVPDTARVIGINLNNLEFQVKNFSNQDISITSFKAVYNVNVGTGTCTVDGVQSACYKTLKIGGQVKYNSTLPRLKSGDTVSFPSSPVTATGTGVAAESFIIRIQSPTTEVPDLNIGKIGKGATVKIEMLDFQDVLSGNGVAVNMTGVNFEVTFSDGSVVVVQF